MSGNITEVKNSYGTTLNNFEGTMPDYLESIGIKGVSYVESANEYLDSIGDNGCDFFDGMDLEPYIPNEYDDEYGLENAKEAFSNKVYDAYSEFEKRYELQVGVTQTYNEETHKPEYTAQVVPLFHDTETGEYKSLYDVAKEFSDALPCEVDADTIISQSFTYGSGWECVIEEMTYDTSDIDADKAVEKNYDVVKKYLDDKIQKAENEMSMENDSKEDNDSKQSKNRKSKDSYER